MNNPPAPGDWVRQPKLDLLSAVNLSAVEEALAAAFGVVFGWHYHYYGGGSRTLVHFDGFDTYLVHVERARPGDHLTLFDLDTMARHAFLRFGVADTSARQTLSDADWDWVREMLRDETQEVVLVRRFIGPLTGSLLVDVDELWAPDDEEWADVRRRFFWGWGEALFFSQSVFDLDTAGGQVATVTARDSSRVNALVDAKRPDAQGFVPQSGSY